MNTLESPSTRSRSEVADACDWVDRFLDLAGDVALDGLGRRAGVRDLDDDERERDVGPEIDRKPREREEPERDEREHHRREDGPLDRRVGEEHRR